MDGMYLDEPLERLKFALFVVAITLFSIIICVGFVAWIFTGDIDILARTLLVFVIATLMVRFFFGYEAEGYRPSPPDSSHPDMDVWTEDEL
ncbi:MAG: hypothetical protein U0516_01955 [Candidatus Saccharibacteria bacterium]